jgi:peptidoglycan/LPS O-acetylase OafA/YrhL
VEAGEPKKKSKNEIARERLDPLEQGERPLVVTIAAVISLLIALSNVVLLAVDVEVGGQQPTAFGTLSFAAIMLLAAYGLWRSRYWAVLGFQALLAIVLLLTGISLAVVGSAWGALIELAVLIAAGTMFWFMVKAIARIQMPQRR